MSVGISNNYVNIQNQPVFCGSKAMKQANKWRRELKHIDLIPNSPVSDAFVKERAGNIQSLDIVGKKIIKPEFIKQRELRFSLAQKTSDIYPELKGITPRGWPEGRTWDNCGAISRGGEIGLFEKPIALQRQASISSVRHEIGHELNRLFKKVIGIEFKETKGYTEAYMKDIADLPENFRKYGKKVRGADHYINYIVQGSTPQKATEAGKREAFAEIFAMLNGGSKIEEYAKGMDKLYKKVFPNTTAYVEKLLWLLGKR